MGKPGDEDQMLNYEAHTALYGGRVSTARALTQRAVESAETGRKRSGGSLPGGRSGPRSTRGESRFRETSGASCTGPFKGRDPQALSAIALALTGDSARALRLAEDLGERFPQDTIVQFNYLPAIRAATSLSEHDGHKATEALNASAPYELGGNLETVTFVLYPVYFRGKALLATKQSDAAVAEFQKILDHPGVVRNETIGALAYLELEQRGLLLRTPCRTASVAETSYREFLSLWKDADTDTPALTQAKAEYATLQLSK